MHLVEPTPFKLTVMLDYLFNTLIQSIFLFFIAIFSFVIFYMSLIFRLLHDNSFLSIDFSFSSCYFKDTRTKTSLLQVNNYKCLFSISLIFPHAMQPQAFFGTCISVDLWHARIGHPSTTTTLDVIRSYQLPCNSQKLSSCHDCYMAKAHKLPFTSSPPLEFLHLDVWRPCPVISSNDFHYYLIFVDDYSRFT